MPDYRDRLAESHNDRGIRFENQGNPREGEASFRAALAIRKKLAADFPAIPDYRNNLALQFNNLGAALRQKGNRESEAVLRQGLAIAEKLVAEYPTVPEYRYVLGLTQNGLGAAFSDVRKEPEKAQPWYDMAIGAARGQPGAIGTPGRCRTACGTAGVDGGHPEPRTVLT